MNHTTAIHVRPGEPGRLIVVLPYSAGRVAKIKTIPGRHWHENQEYWPGTRDLKKFRRWFDIELHSTIMDPYYEEEPIEKKFV